MLALQQAVFTATVEDTFDFSFPFRTSRAYEICIAGLPIVADEVVEFLTGLIEFDGLASEIEERHEQSASVSFVAPELQCGDGVAAFAFVESVVLIAGAVMDFI